MSLKIIQIATVSKREDAPITKYHFQSGLFASRLTFIPKRLFAQLALAEVAIW